MKTCNSDPDTLRANILNISRHYQVILTEIAADTPTCNRIWYMYVYTLQNDHSKCHYDSPCRHPAYVSSKVPLTDPDVIAVYEKALRETMICRNVRYYTCTCI